MPEDWYHSETMAEAATTWTLQPASQREVEMADNNSGNGAFVFGLILGAIGGAAAALLKTPKSGDELRNEVAGPVRERAEPYVTQGKERATVILDRAAERAQEFSGKLAAMEIPFDDDPQRVHVEPQPVPPTPTNERPS
jgi:hypothetical protein